MIKRLFDIVLVLFISSIFLIPMILITIVLYLTASGSVLYWSDRIGRNNILFKMPKFRTMSLDAPSVATHLLDDTEQYLTLVGAFLRKSSLDELPQLWNILSGKMTFVGPRPALFNQYDLIELRTKHGIDVLKPGVTGWAQINGRDKLTIRQKVDLDLEYLQRKSLYFDIKIILLTLMRVIKQKDISH